MSEREIIIEMRQALIDCALVGSRVIFGSCWVWTCRMCGATDACNKDGRGPIEHAYFCPIGKLLKQTEKYAKGDTR